jgi:hypothetical protein
VVVLAGDIGVGDSGLHWGRRMFPGSEIVFVLGNHEAYGYCMDTLLERCRETACKHGIHLLERDSVEIAGVMFHGATLWTDYLLGGEPTLSMSQHAARSLLGDHRLITLPDPKSASGRRALEPADLARIHAQTVRWLTPLLPVRRTDGKRRVVVTHHLPSAKATHPRYAGTVLNAAFASHLDHLVSRADLWIAGHTHDAADVMIGRGRLVVNPRGYPHEDGRNGFDPGLVVEV